MFFALLLAPGFLATTYTRAYNALHLEVFAFFGWGALAVIGAAALSIAPKVRLDGRCLVGGCLLFGLLAASLAGQYLAGLSVPYLGMVAIAVYYLLAAASVMVLGMVAAAFFKGAHAEATFSGDALNAGLTAAVGVACASALVGVAQYLKLPADEFFVTPVGPAGLSYGNMRQPNLFALGGILGIVALTALHNRLNKESWRVGLLCAALFALLLSGVAASGSRAGTVLVVMLSAWGLLEFWRAGKPHWMLLLAVPCYFLIKFAAAQVDSVGALPFAGGQRPGLITTALQGDMWRQATWLKSLTLVWLNPLWGVGFGNIDFALFTQTLPVARAPVTEHAHNIFLQLAVEHGLPVTTGWALTLTWLVVRSRRALRSFEGRALAAFLVAVMFHSLVEYPLWYAYFLLPSAFVLGAFVQYGSPAQAEIVELPRENASGRQTGCAEHNVAMLSRLHAVSLGLCGVLTVGLAWAALLDYAKASPIYRLDLSSPLSARVAVGYESVLFQNLADYAALGLVRMSPEVAPVRKLFNPNSLIGLVTLSPENAPKQLALVSRVAHFRFDPQVAAIYAASAAFAGKLDLAKAAAYRLTLKDATAANQLRSALAGSDVQYARDLATFLAKIEPVPWPEWEINSSRK